MPKEQPPDFEMAEVSCCICGHTAKLQELPKGSGEYYCFLCASHWRDLQMKKHITAQEKTRSTEKTIAFRKKVEIAGDDDE